MRKKLLLIFLVYSFEEVKSFKLFFNLINYSLKKKYKVIVYVSGNGIYNFIDSKNLSEDFKKLIADGFLKVKICDACIIDKKIDKQFIIKGPEITGIAELFYLMNQSKCFIKI